MASINLSGVLLNSIGEVDVGGVITFTHLTNTGETIASTRTEFVIPPDGAYSIDLEYGQIRVDYTTKETERFVAIVIVNSDSTATSLPELLSATTPVARPIIIQMQGLVADAVAAETAAVAAANSVSVYGFNDVSEMTASALAITANSTISTLNYSNGRVGGGAKYQALTLANFTTQTGNAAPDEIKDHTLLNGLVAMLLPENGIITVQQCGAIPFDNTQPTADINRDAFRSAHASSLVEWEAMRLATQRRYWSTKVDAGDYNLSNGYTVPKGMVSFCDSLGSARIKVLGATVDANPVLPLVSLGRVINGTATETASGLYVLAPPPKVHNLYLNPQNSGTACDVTNVQGFAIGDLWIQAERGIVFGGTSTGDGVVGNIFLEDSTGQGLVFEDCQNIVIDNVYSFVCNFPLLISGAPNNIDIGVVECNYTLFTTLETSTGASPRNFKIGRLVCNQNAQYGSFTGGITLRSNVCDIRIDRYEAYNYNGSALLALGSTVGNKIDIGVMVLKQQISSLDYVQGTTADGFFIRNADLTIGRLETDILADYAIGYVSGTLETNFNLRSAYIEGQTETANPLMIIDNTNVSSTVRLTDVDNQSGRDLFNLQDFVEVTFDNIKKPFPIISEGGRLAIKVPFNNGSLYDFTVRTNTLVAGSGSYRKAAKFTISVEKLFSGVLSWHADLTTISSNNFGTTVPAIDLQVDLGAVGDGVTIASSNSDYLVLSLPSTYTSITYNLVPSIS